MSTELEINFCEHLSESKNLIISRKYPPRLEIAVEPTAFLTVSRLARCGTQHYFYYTGRPKQAEQTPKTNEVSPQ